MPRNLQRQSRNRILFARNRAFTPFNPARMPSGIPARVTTTPAQEAELRKKGVLPAEVEAFERHGGDYPLPLPQVFQGLLNLDDSLAALAGGGALAVAGFRMIRNSVADRLRFFVQTSNPDTFALLRFALTINGQPMSQQQFFTLPFVVNMQGFHRWIDSQANVQVVATVRPGAVLLPPLGTIEAQLFVDGYQGKFR